MASKPLRFHPQAEQEYLTALAWYRERSLIAATNFEGAFGRAIARIREAPQRWPIYSRISENILSGNFLSASRIKTSFQRS